MPPSPFSVRPTLRTCFVCCVLFAGTLLLFSRALDYGFSNFDDPTYVTSNRHVQAGLSWDSMVWAFTHPADYWHPLTWLSHMLDWQLFGDDAFGHHVTSVLWHAANAVLAFLVLRRLTGAYWTSAFAAALFAWHPLRVESVVWITERKDVMSGFFFLLTLWAYAAYVRRLQSPDTCGPLREERDHPSSHSAPSSPASSPASARRFYVLTLVCFLGGLMSKPMLVTVPVVLLILDVWPFQRLPAAGSLWSRCRALLIEKLPFFVLSAITSVVTVLMQRGAGAFALDLPLDARLGNAFVSIVRYLAKFFRPVDLTILYPHPGYWPLLAVLGAVALTLALTALAWSQRRRHPWLLTGWLLFLVMLLPAIGLLQVGVQAMADRYTYLPILGLQLALFWTISTWAVTPTARRILGAAAALTLVGCIARTWDQQFTWRNPIAMFQHSIVVEEHNEIGHAMLGYTLLSFDRFDEAERHSQRALELNPRNNTALASLAVVREHQNRLDEAESFYRAALAAHPGHPRMIYQLGLLLLRLNRTDEAIAQIADAIRNDADRFESHLMFAAVESRHGNPQRALPFYQAALAAHPGNPSAHLGAGLALNKLGRPHDARTHFEAAVAVQPDFPHAHAELGLLALSANDAQSAAAHFRAALASAPDFAVAHVGLGRAAEKLGLTAEATASFETALRLSPDDAVPHRVWADTLARRKQFPDAIRHYERSIALDPKNAESHAALGYLLLFTGRPHDARTHWETALRLDPNFPGLRQRLQQLR